MFFINVPIGILAIILAALWVADLKPAESPKSRKLDLGGGVPPRAALLCVLFPIVEVNEFHTGWLFLLFVPAVALIWAFIRRESHLTREDKSPLLDLRLFQVPTFTTGVAFAVVFFCSNTGIPLVLSLYYQQGLGFSALQSGLGVSALALGSVVGATVAGRLVSRIGRPLVLGAVSLFILSTTAIGLVVHLSLQLTNPVEVVLDLSVPLFLLGLAGGSIVTPNQTLTLMDVDPRRRGERPAACCRRRSGSARPPARPCSARCFFLAVASFATSHQIGRPATDPAAFANALDTGLIGSLFFRARRSFLGLIDLRRKRGDVTPGVSV
ncbi:MAG: MFS transporter [Galbitalea sp.]